MNISYVLGIDTSNYKTSVSIVGSDGNIVCNIQEFLRVKKGERGLRQSDALFQHINKLPELIEKAFQTAGNIEISAVSVSTKPRPVEGSYMPVFNAGISAGRMIAATLKVPLFTFSHQEGHIEAVKYNSVLKNKEEFISFHFSGGTTEALYVNGKNIQIVGGTKDIALGQVIDRVGVALGYSFPCGEAMDKIISDYIPDTSNKLTKIKVIDGYVNLSGIESQAQRLVGKTEDKELIYMVFYRLAEAITGICKELSKKYNTKDFLFAGGVSSSRYMRKFLKNNLESYNLCFGDPALSTDNAVGIAFLGGKKIWQ